MKPRLVVSVGCPSGIGPEVSVHAAAKAKGPVCLVGDEAQLQRAAAIVKVSKKRLVRVASVPEAWGLKAPSIAIYQPTPALSPRDAKWGASSRAGGASQLAWINAACDAVLRGDADAIVTGPVSKEAIATSGAKGSRGFLGHTEHLLARTGGERVVMAFYAEAFTTALVTTHLPLKAVPRAITPSKVLAATECLAHFLRSIGHKRPRIAVCGLNPHAGEGGLLGNEEIRTIGPAVRLAASRVPFARIAGPVPAESAFRLAVAREFDGVVAMYHDQATIPMKLVGFGDAVNVSLGLPIVRTSVDHGTGYDRAGKGTADARGMLSALELASRLASAKA